MTFMKNFCVHKVSIHIIFNIVECARKNSIYVPQSHRPAVFLWDVEEPSFLKRNPLKCCFSYEKYTIYIHLFRNNNFIEKKRNKNVCIILSTLLSALL